MDELSRTRQELNRQLDAAISTAPLDALAAIAATQQDLSAHQLAAVRAAVPDHTWADIGKALGVTKQAAQQRYAREWANALKEELKTEVKAMRSALRSDEPEVAAAARAKRSAAISEFKAVHRRAKQQ
jgi:hypothetical protein